MKTAIKKPVAPVSKKPVKAPVVAIKKSTVVPVKKTSKATVTPIKKDLTPLEKARLARANGTAKPKAERKPLPLFKAPEDFKPHFLEVLVKTDKDGLLSNLCKATRYVGRYDPQAPDKKKIDLGGYDQTTLQGILSRFSMVTYVTNVAKRLPVNTTFKILLRVNRKAKDGSLSILFKQVSVGKKSAKTGRVTAVELDKKDVQYRMFRKSSRIMPAAFKDVLMPPKRVRGVKVVEDNDE